MNDTSGGNFEDRLRAALVERAGLLSAPPDGAGMSHVAARARLRHTRRRWEAATLAVVVVMAVGLTAAVTSGGAGPRETAGRPIVPGHAGSPGGHRLDRRDGVLLLPLSGTVSASSPGDTVAQGFGVAAPGSTTATTVPNPEKSNAAVPGTASATTTAPIDVAPPSSTPLQRLYGHTSPDGVQMTAFDQPAGGAGSAPAFNAGGVFNASPEDPGCLTTTQLTIEVSDIDAVGTVTEPLFKGATGALVDVQIGEIGNTEGAPATWVMAQVGAGAATVQVQFADGVIDQATVPATGVVVLGHKGAPVDALGNGSVAAINVVGSDGQVLADYGLGTEASVPASSDAPSSLPAPGAAQPADPAGATAAIARALATALGCSASPVQRVQTVVGGDVLETLPFAGSAVVHVDHVVFTSATAAVAQYHLDSGLLNSGQQEAGPLYAAATLTANVWQLSLASIAPGLEVTPANQVGNVTVAPGGPLFVKSWPGGTAVAVYRALPGSQSASGYGTGEAACTPAGGVVEEVTTPGAVHVLTAALFPNYTAPLIDAAVSSVGSAEGAPATVIDVEVGPQAASVSVTSSTATVQESPVDGEAVIVLPGDPSTALAGAGSQLQVSDNAGAGLATVSLQVEASAPAGPSTLPTSLPTTAGAAPADPQAATQAITQAFAVVFDCATPPVQRVQSIQDGSLVAGALEQLDTGPYEALASSSYIDVQHVVFENPTLADVAYTLRFHSDAGLIFPMVGQAVVVAGSWRVSYGTICAAIQLGLGNCQS
ncbi:MAG TPA: hypothetical protein VII76_13775 [Acidimicrobiales bacterium]